MAQGQPEPIGGTALSEYYENAINSIINSLEAVTIKEQNDIKNVTNNVNGLGQQVAIMNNVVSDVSSQIDNLTE